MKFKIKLLSLLVLLLVFSPAVMAEGEGVEYSGHVQDIGWMSTVSNGATAGTTGQAKRVEALKINLVGAPNSHITYASHVEDIGWQPEVADGAISGTTGQSKRVEAIKINLSGDIAATHDIYYRTHVSDFGWLGWAKNGEEAGTSGFAKRMEALEIMLVPKGQAAPGSTENRYIFPQGIGYQAHVQNIGWQDKVLNGGTAGTTGQNLQVEAMKVSLYNLPGGVEYNTYVENKGWMTPVANGQDSGTTGQNLHIEAMNIVLTGEAATHYDLYYRTHVADVGWLGWAANGAPAGSYDGDKAVQAFEIVLVDKGAAAPGDTNNSYVNLEHLRKVSAQPGVRTVKNFLLTALQPVGQTLYVYGGGWNEPDTGAGEGALTIGLHPNWKPFFDRYDANYDFNQTRFQINNGLDCSGYVGWAVYNTLNTQSGNAAAGEVYLADRQARRYAEKGYGSYTDYQQVSNYLPGDIVSLNEDAHVYIVIGQCGDGSVVLAHASPPGVMLSGTLGSNGEQTEATQLARHYMQTYYPEYYNRYNAKLDRNRSPYLTRTSKMTWGDNFVGDPDGIRNHNAAEVLKILFNEK